ncbi:MAG: Rad2 nuclease, partial [Paramarteilia canceri]
HIKNCLKYIDLLLKFKLVPVLVFDGKSLPAKKETDLNRKNIREANKQIVLAMLKNDSKNIKMNLLGSSLDIDHNIAHPLIQICQLRNIRCIVAPYEADAQLAFLSKAGILDYVISEDSDLLPYNCHKVIFKLDFKSGYGTLIKYENIQQIYNYRTGFSPEKFQMTCILSGCDYLKSLKGVGLKKAYQFINKYHCTDVKKMLGKLCSFTGCDKAEVDEYIIKFLDAYNTFKYQIIFDPFSLVQRPLEDVPEGFIFQHNAGTVETDTKLALDLAIGNVHPETMIKMSCFSLLDFNVFKQNNKTEFYDRPDSLNNKNDSENSQKEDFNTSVINRIVTKGQQTLSILNPIINIKTSSLESNTSNTSIASQVDDESKLLKSSPYFNGDENLEISMVEEGKKEFMPLFMSKRTKLVTEQFKPPSFLSQFRRA